ncbi:unnamed protein product [Brassica oleracea var. botrytis]
MAGANADDDRNNRRIASQSMDSAADVPGKRGNEDASSLVEISCSICLELVVDDGSRSCAKLQCGHQFHLVSFKCSHCKSTIQLEHLSPTRDKKDENHDDELMMNASDKRERERDRTCLMVICGV